MQWPQYDHLSCQHLRDDARYEQASRDTNRYKGPIHDTFGKTAAKASNVVAMLEPDRTTLDAEQAFYPVWVLRNDSRDCEAFGWVKEVVGLASAANGTNNKAEEADLDAIVVV